MAKSMGYNAASGLGSMLKEGHKHFDGVDEATARNIEAARNLSAITRTSLGPHGMNKLVINHLEKILVTSDTATIVQELEVVHPAANLLVMAAKMQEQEMGDATNFVVSFVGELLYKSVELLRSGLSPTEISAGFQRAFEKAQELMETLVCETLEDPRDLATLTRAVKPVLAAKQYGFEDLLAPFVAEACLNVMPAAPRRATLNADNVRVCKLMGGNIQASEVVRGVVVTRDTLGAIKTVENAKIAVFSCGLEASATEAKGTVLIKNAEELMNFSKGEEKQMEESVATIAEAGVNVIVSGGSVSDLALHFAERYGVMVLKIQSKFELRRLCRSIGATAMPRLGAPTPEEAGQCDLVTVREFGDRRVTIFRQDDDSSAVSTIVLRASTENLLNDLERAIDDAVNCVKALCRDPRFLPGAGAVELELARLIRNFGESCPGLDQYAIRTFAECLEFVPRTLAENAGQNAADVLSALYAAHAAGNVNVGVDIEGDGAVADMAAQGVIDLYATKMSALRLATDCARTVISVDCIIVSKQAGGPKPRQPGAPDA